MTISVVDHHMGSSNSTAQGSEQAGSSNVPRHQHLRICVVGAGAAGLATLKIMKDSDEFKSGAWTIDVYEQRDDVGGTW